MELIIWYHDELVEYRKVSSRNEKYLIEDCGIYLSVAAYLVRRADCLRGVNAWRRLVAYIDHGKGIKP